MTRRHRPNFSGRGLAKIIVKENTDGKSKKALRADNGRYERDRP